MLDYGFDAGFRKNAEDLICGVDEAGRGPLAGPVVAGACILPPDIVIPGLDDSKKLTEKKRDALYDVIISKALYWGIGEASPAEIDEYNILNASLLAMRRAIEAMGVLPHHLLIDGNQTRGFTLPCTAVVHGDATSQSIAAASVLAKVTRDRMCEGMDSEYPAYGFAGHKGYPTKAHKLAVYRYGPAPCHRRSFLSFLEKDREKLEKWLAEALDKEKESSR
ncbi:MAG: ribonuclease HII [Ruminococcaceae bacterium]|nr:ribonuclease HII [Oscillospiraceae bacterium]